MEQELRTAVAERQRAEVRPEEIVAPTMATAGSIGAAAGGVVACILAVLGLAGVAPNWMAPIGIAVVGLSLLVGGGLIAATAERPYGGIVPGMVFAAGAGAAGIALGILGFVNVAPHVLLPVAAILYGAAFLPGSFAVYRFGSRLARREEGRESEALTAAMGTEVVFALGSVVLGIIGLAGAEPMLLTLVGTLVLGSGLLIGGAALAACLVAAGRR